MSSPTYPTTSEQISRDWVSFGGADVRLVCQGQTIGTAQGFSYAVQREKGPVYVLGSKDPKSFSRGKRGIAGTLISLMLDSHILMSNKSPFRNLGVLVAKDELLASPDDLNDASNTADLDLVDSNYEFDASSLSDAYQIHTAWFIDQLPPVDFVVVAVSEYGQAATMRVYGIEFLNEGSGVSVDDLMIENQHTWVARTMSYWQPLGSWSTSGVFTPA